MANYKKTVFSYRFIENTPENADELVSYGIAPAALFPGVGILINVELDKVEEPITVDDFALRYEPIV